MALIIATNTFTKELGILVKPIARERLCKVELVGGGDSDYDRGRDIVTRLTFYPSLLPIPAC